MINARPRAALAVGVASLILAAIGALGPADEIRSTYTWPPQSMPVESPAELWYTALPLVHRQPDSLSVRVPCSLPQALEPDAEPTTVIATAREPRGSRGLAVTTAGDVLTVQVGEDVLGELNVPASAATDQSCAYGIQFFAGRWAITGGPERVTLSGRLETPVVFGLFSSLDLRSARAPTVEVTTAVHDTRTTALQAIAWILAGVGVVGALLLLSTLPRSRVVWDRLAHGIARASMHVHLADAVVVATLVGWWVVAPVIWDDGWVVARERAFAASGGFSTYYNALGVNLPLDYWVEWLHHWLAEWTTDVLVLRAHALVALLAIWVLCRWALQRLTREPRSWNPAVWALASAFLVGALAWDMAIRPEPVTALLATGVAACVIRFTERETVAPLAIASLLVPLALTAHHTGIVSLAPVVAASPQLLRWARPRLAAAGALVVAATAWAVVLGFVGSDVGHRLDDARTSSDLGITSPWRDELHRYVLVDSFPWATPVRRASVALIGLALLAFVSRRRRGDRLLDLPATMLVVSLVLLLVTPSKIPWHFGALTGLLALTVAVEVSRLRDEGASSRGWELRPFLLIGAVVGAAAWVWFPRDAWNPLDLRTLSWDPGLDSVFPFSSLAIVLPGLVLGAAMILGARRGHRFGGSATPWSVALWTAPLFAAPLILFTFGVLAGDLVRTDGWTLTRQNLGSFIGRAGCGLGDDGTASLWSSSRPLALVGPGPIPHAPEWVPSPPVAGLRTFGLSDESRETPWFRIPSDKRLGIFAAGSGVPGGSLQLQWGGGDDGEVEVLHSEVVEEIAPRIESIPWTFVAASELPEPHPNATFVRIATAPSTVPGASVAVTAPVSYRTERLSDLLREPEATALVHPNLLLYFPCARQPRLAEGIVEAPRYFVWFDHPFQPHPYEATSPFLGVRDLYAVQRVPLTDGSDPPPGVVVYEIERRIPGAAAVAPDVGTDGS